VPNNGSVVLSVDIGGLRALMLGDVETGAAHEVLLALRREPAYAGAGGYDVLKVAHHGSRLQDPTLLAEVRAPVALISVGAATPMATRPRGPWTCYRPTVLRCSGPTSVVT